MKYLAKKITRNFTKHRDYNLYMDIYYPKQLRRDQACILSLHSGEFVSGARNDKLQTQIVEALLGRGFIVASAI